MSADGRWVAFHSRASNLVEQLVSGNWNVYVYDTLMNTTQVISDSRMQSFPDNVTRSVYNWCRSPSLASNATTVAFWCQRSEYQLGGMLVYDTVVCDFSADVTAPLNCSVLSVTPSGLVSVSQFAGPEISGAPSLSSSGRFIAWATTANDIITDPDSRGNIYPDQPSRIVIRDREANVTYWAVTRTAPDDYKEYRPWLTADGSKVFFEGTSPSYLLGVNSTSIQQIYYDTLNSTSPIRDRPVAWSVPSTPLATPFCLLTRPELFSATGSVHTRTRANVRKCLYNSELTSSGWPPQQTLKSLLSLHISPILWIHATRFTVATFAQLVCATIHPRDIPNSAHTAAISPLIKETAPSFTYDQHLRRYLIS